ncbi:MAG: hypothetical protein OEL54_06825 [Flavobacteriaceae bacterium]|nr:hypothetical protein [Flavobacteriaceae bacterium]
MKDKIKFLLLLFFITFSPYLAGATVIGKGQAIIISGNEVVARKQAVDNAQRDAIEKGAGTFLSASTKVKNWEVIRDDVFTTARGLVKTVREIKDQKENGVWYYEFEAEVTESTNNIKNKLQELRILHQKMGNKRLMVIYTPVQENAFEENDPAVNSARDALKQGLNELGFTTFNQQKLSYQYEKLHKTEGIKPKEAWKQIANDNQVDIIVEFELWGGKQRNRAMGIARAKSGIRVNVFDVSTSRDIATSQTEQSQVTSAKPGSYEWNNSLTKAANKAAQVVASESAEKIIKYYMTVGDIGNAFELIFKNFTEDETDKIQLFLETFEGYQSSSILEFQPELMKIEYYSNLRKGRLPRLIKGELKRNGIIYQTKEIKGSRLVFGKPNR